MPPKGLIKLRKPRRPQDNVTGGYDGDTARPIRVMVEGVVRRCEVKGSTMDIHTIEFTFNEVEHGVAFAPVDLIVVDKIVRLGIRIPARSKVRLAGDEGYGSTGRQSHRI
jgi:hypothetical protein